MGASGAEPAKAPEKTLEESFQAALRRSETIGIQSELLVQAEERYRQATGSILPNVSFTNSNLWQEQPDATGATAFFPAVQPLTRLTIAQPLFRGFREFAGIRASRADTQAQQEARRAAALALYSDVVRSFFTVLSLERDLQNLRSEIGLYRRRVLELNQRKAIGRSRAGEVLTTESLLLSIKAQSEGIEGQIRAERELFAFLTGFAPDVPLVDSAPPETEALSVVDLPELETFSEGLEARPDVKAEVKRVDFAREAVTIAKGAHWPTIDLLGNYYFARYGNLADVNWDFQFVISLPIYAGGTIQSQVRQAASQQRQAELSSSRIRRAADQEIRSLYQLVRADRRQLNALKDAEILSEKSYLEQSREYRLGLVTNIDVLQALTSYQENHRAFDRARFNAKINYMRLLAASSRQPLPPFP